MLFSLLFSLTLCNLVHVQCSQWNSTSSTWSTTQESVESSKGHTIKICSNYGYGHWNMKIPWDFRTSELLGSFKHLKQILNFDKFKPALCGFQFSYLKLIVKNRCYLFQKYVNSNTAWIGNSRPRFKNRVEIAVNFIRHEFHWSVRNSRQLCTFWQKTDIRFS